MELAGVVIAVLALGVALITAERQVRQARNANVVPVLIDLMREHRSDRLTAARRFVYRELRNRNLEAGMSGLPKDERELVRDLMSYYDNLGAMVAHRVVGLRPIAGYLGGNVSDMWRGLEPLVMAERSKRHGESDPDRWQWYFEYLASRVRQTSPAKVRGDDTNSRRRRQL